MSNPFFQTFSKIFTFLLRNEEGVTPWLIVIGGIIVFQILATLIFTNQSWSMPIGLACIIFVCAAITIKFRPEKVNNKWRWYLMAIAFVIWGVGFVAIAVQDNFLNGFELFSGIASVIRQLFLIAALMPSALRENTKKFHTLDVAQGCVFALLLGTLTWKPLFASVYIGPNQDFITTGYSVLALLATLSSFIQEDRPSRAMIGRIALLLVVYGFISELSIYLHYNYRLRDNSPVWLLGDVSFIVYALSYSGRRMQRASFPSGGGNMRHLTPLFIMLMIFLLALAAARINMWAAMSAGAVGIIIYASRTTMLLNNYLLSKDKAILAEQSHSRLLIDMIHEIRAPLGSVVLYASMLQRTDKLDGQHSKWLQQIGSGTARVTTMLNDVLDIERIDAGLLQVFITPCNIEKIIQGSIELVRMQAAEAGIKIDVNIDYYEHVLVDGSKLDRVLINILNNAVRFTHTGGSILVSCYKADNGSVLIRITDTGVGIDSALQPMLFVRFSKIGTPVRGLLGSGLGLSICQGMMAAMDGTITIESELGRGTSVTLELKINK